MGDDPFGHLLDALDKRPGRGVEIVERDDGLFFTGGGRDYLDPFPKWFSVERRAFRFVRGRVLDLGSGGGRVLIELQRRGFEAVGIEHSPLVARVARRRGARNVKVMSVEDVDGKLGTFDTVVMYGNNFGMLGTVTKTRRLLRNLLDITSDEARILAGNATPYPARTKVGRAYYARNRERGKLPGTIRIRLRFAEHVTPWFDWLFVSPRELEQLLRGTGWHVARVVKNNGAAYVAIIEKDATASARRRVSG